MSKLENISYQRPHGKELRKRLLEERRFLQVLAGPRQVGKTTLVRQVTEELGLPSHMVSADEPGMKDLAWLNTQWQRGRMLCRASEHENAVLVLDEIQKLPGWSETVKRLWDEDTLQNTPLRVVLLGSSPLMVQRGLTESLAGRFETLQMGHWSFGEMREAFGFSLEEFLLYGGYPGAAPLRGDAERWRMYVLDALIETTVSRDILLMNRVDKPILLRRLFDIGCQYSGQIVSFTKILGQMQDAGNSTTLAHYLELLQGGGLLCGLQKYAGDVLRRRASSPKFHVMNTALMTAMRGVPSQDLLMDPERRGRWVESAVGAHLINSAIEHRDEVYYWREGSNEVDFVYSSRGRRLTLEVKSGKRSGGRAALDLFSKLFGADNALIVGTDGIPLEEFLSVSPHIWLKGV